VFTKTFLRRSSLRCRTFTPKVNNNEGGHKGTKGSKDMRELLPTSLPIFPSGNLRGGSNRPSAQWIAQNCLTICLNGPMLWNKLNLIEISDCDTSCPLFPRVPCIFCTSRIPILCPLHPPTTLYLWQLRRIKLKQQYYVELVCVMSKVKYLNERLIALCHIINSAPRRVDGRKTRGKIYVLWRYALQYWLSTGNSN
jgi:hypothetical protein